MKAQSSRSKYLMLYRFHRPFGVLEAIRRVASVFLELDLFDFRRGVNTRTIKVTKLAKPTYMPYWPAFTSVVKEMIKFSHNYYISAIRYSDLDRQTVFVDFGAGLGKTPILAAESQKFDLSCGIEIDGELVEQARVNFKELSKKSPQLIKLFIEEGNVENKSDIELFVKLISDMGINPDKCTLFIFNKNSYGPDVLRNSLKLIEGHFSSIVYLYQNPIHQSCLNELGYIEFGQDDKPSTAHKNFKYKLYFKHKYNMN